MFKAIAFDLDGVITDTAEYHYLAWKKLGEKLNISIDREFNEQLKGVSRQDSLDLILKLGNQEDKFSKKEKEDLMIWKNNLYTELIQSLTEKDILPGILNLLTNLKKNNIKTAIASASKNAPMILKKLGILDYFDVIIDPTTLKNGKPFPDIFLAAALELGYNTSEMIGIEDSEAGIRSINDAKMFSVGVGKLAEADYLVSNTSLLLFENIDKAFNFYNK